MSCCIFRRASQLADADDDEAMSYYIAGGCIAEVIDFLSTRGQHTDAMLVAAAVDEGSIMPLTNNKKKNISQTTIKDSTSCRLLCALI